MQTLVRNIQLNFATGEKKLTVGNLSLQKNYINILEIAHFKDRGCLFTKEHSSMQTQFDLTGAEDCQLISFDEHFKFKTDEEYLSFMYEEFAMEIFGHSPSTEMSTFYDLNDLIAKHKDNISFLLISKQIGKTKPATLFFISKFGCEIEKVIFYNQLTKNKIWNEFDVLLYQFAMFSPDAPAPPPTLDVKVIA